MAERRVCLNWASDSESDVESCLQTISLGNSSFTDNEKVNDKFSDSDSFIDCTSQSMCFSPLSALHTEVGKRENKAKYFSDWSFANVSEREEKVSVFSSSSFLSQSTTSNDIYFPELDKLESPKHVCDVEDELFSNFGTTTQKNSLKLQKPTQSLVQVILSYNSKKSCENKNILINEVSKGFSSGFKSVKSSSGVLGAFFLKGENNNIIAVFKPQKIKSTRSLSTVVKLSSVFSPLHKNMFLNQNVNSEVRNILLKVSQRKLENMKINSKEENMGKKVKERSLRKGIKGSETAIRELACFALDKKYEHFVNIPEILLVKIHNSFLKTNVQSENENENRNRKERRESEFNFFRSQSSLTFNNLNTENMFQTGTLHKFVFHDSTCEDFSFSNFSVLSVQKIAVFDLLTLNLDRHEGNILLTLNKEREDNILTPIDHGLTFPEITKIENDTEFCWINFSQVKTSLCSEVKNFIQKLDNKTDFQLFDELFGKSQKTEKLKKALKLGTLLLKLGLLKYNLTVFEVATLLSSNFKTYEKDRKNSVLNGIICEILLSFGFEKEKCEKQEINLNEVNEEKFFEELEKKLENYFYSVSKEKR